MAEHMVHEQLEFGRIRPNESEDVLVMRAKQILSFFADRHTFYTDVLGLEHIGADPLPNPANMDEVSEIVHQIQGEKGQTETYSFVGAFAVGASELDELQDDTERFSPLRGLMILRKPEGHCTPGNHTETEIVEWAVRTRERGQGNGKKLAVAAYSQTRWLCDGADTLFTTIPEGDVRTTAWLPYYGFERSETPPVRDPEYDTNRLRLEVPNVAFMDRIAPPHESSPPFTAA